jgi:RNA polymerase sigma factor for flagellar operon FliA
MARTLGPLWSRYLEVREKLRAGEGLPDEAARREAERQAGQLRDRLLINYSPLVKYVAGRVGARMTGAIEQEDMISWGVMGLLDAIETYDPTRPGKKAKFESYAISKIRWAIFDQLRRQDWVPRRVRLRAQEIEAAKVKLIQELRRPPTEAEIAGEVGIKVAEYHDFLERYSRAQVASLEARSEVDGGPGIEYGAFIEDSLAVDPQSQANLEDLRAQLIDAIGLLEERERLVATFYFYEGLTLKEIGKALGLTEGRISQILRDALTKLREHLKRSSLAHEDWQAFS